MNMSAAEAIFSALFYEMARLASFILFLLALHFVSRTPHHPHARWIKVFLLAAALGIIASSMPLVQLLKDMGYRLPLPDGNTLAPILRRLNYLACIFYLYSAVLLLKTLRHTWPPPPNTPN
jgi:hypothetical protein